MDCVRVILLCLVILRVPSRTAATDYVTTSSLDVSFTVCDPGYGFPQFGHRWGEWSAPSTNPITSANEDELLVIDVFQQGDVRFKLKLTKSGQVEFSFFNGGTVSKVIPATAHNFSADSWATFRIDFYFTKTEVEPSIVVVDSTIEVYDQFSNQETVPLYISLLTDAYAPICLRPVVIEGIKRINVFSATRNFQLSTDPKLWCTPSGWQCNTEMTDVRWSTTHTGLCSGPSYGINQCKKGI